MSGSLQSYVERVRTVLGSLTSPYLDAAGEAGLQAEAAQLGVPPAEAERHLLLLSCEREPAVGIERVLEAEFREQVCAAIKDRFLDERERKVLRDQGHKLFAHARDPEEITERILSEVLAEENAISEETLRLNLKKDLGDQKSLSPEDWKGIRERRTEGARKAGVDTKENDLDEIFEDAREERKIQIELPLLGRLAIPLLVLWAAIIAVLTYEILVYFS